MSLHKGAESSGRGKHLRDTPQPQKTDRPDGNTRPKLLIISTAVLITILLSGALTYKLLEKVSTNGFPVTNGVVTPEENEQLTGWVQGEDGISRYYDPIRHTPYLGWLKDGDTTRYFDGTSGEPYVGWLDLGGRLYWLDDGAHQSKGALLTDQWLTTESGEYYLLSDGSAAVGWKEIDGKPYYFDALGKLQTGWIDDGSGKIYWIKPEDKTLPHHEWIEMDGVFQAFDDDGSWVNNGEIIPPNDAENVANMTSRQQAVVDACDITPWPGKGYCAAWVSDVFVNAGEPSVYGDACDIARAWCTSDDLGDLKPGMIIAVPRHSRTENGLIWGHLCIYAGNGLVRDSGGTSTRWVTLGTGFAWYGTLESPKWGWANGIPLD